MKIRQHFVEMLFAKKPRVWLHCEEIHYKAEDYKGDKEQK